MALRIESDKKSLFYVQMLMEANAWCALPNGHGERPMDLARQRGANSSVALIQEKVQAKLDRVIGLLGSQLLCQLDQFSNDPQETGGKNDTDHDGEVEVDYDAWMDHDEDIHGMIDTDDMRRRHPANFCWSCCGERGNVRRCLYAYSDDESEEEDEGPHPIDDTEWRLIMLHRKFERERETAGSNKPRLNKAGLPCAPPPSADHGGDDDAATDRVEDSDDSDDDSKKPSLCSVKWWHKYIVKGLSVTSTEDRDIKAIENVFSPNLAALLSHAVAEPLQDVLQPPPVERDWWPFNGIIRIVRSFTTIRQPTSAPNNPITPKESADRFLSHFSAHMITAVELASAHGLHDRVQQNLEMLAKGVLPLIARIQEQVLEVKLEEYREDIEKLDQQQTELGQKILDTKKRVREDEEKLERAAALRNKTLAADTDKAREHVEALLARSHTEE
jgi:hypothetical protein